MRTSRSVIALLAVGVAGLTYYGLHSRPGPGLGNRPALSREMDEFGQSDSDLSDSAPADSELDRRRQVLMRRVGARDQAVRQLLDGRLTLGEAAARFRAIDKELPVTWGPQRTAGGTEESERLCRDIIARAHGWVLANLPAEAATVAARLEAELERLRGPDGVVRLPD